MNLNNIDLSGIGDIIKELISAVLNKVSDALASWYVQRVRQPVQDRFARGSRGARRVYAEAYQNGYWTHG